MTHGTPRNSCCCKPVGHQAAATAAMALLLSSASFLASAFVSNALQFFSRSIRASPLLHKVVKVLDRGKTKVCLLYCSGRRTPVQQYCCSDDVYQVCLLNEFHHQGVFHFICCVGGSASPYYPKRRHRRSFLHCVVWLPQQSVPTHFRLDIQQQSSKKLVCLCEHPVPTLRPADPCDGE